MNNPVKTEDLTRVLEEVFGEPLLNVRRQPSAYSSSFPIEHLQIAFPDGRAISVIFKNLGRDAILDGASRVKPGFLYDSRREIDVYRYLHPALDLGAPKLHGASGDWLFLEYVPAPELYQIGDFEVWLEAARWLARLHASRASEPVAARKLVPQLLEHDAAYYDAWRSRAHAFAGAKLDRIVESYPGVMDVLLALPRTLIHGEFYASNVLVQTTEQGVRICPVDWEMAAIGPGILDVAALASGKWGRERRSMMAQAYCDALPETLRPPNLIAAFECAQLQMALQWLGWSGDWPMYKEHAQDWLAEALRAHGSLQEAMLV
jgi:hypothetical protein